MNFVQFTGVTSILGESMISERDSIIEKILERLKYQSSFLYGKKLDEADCKNNIKGISKILDDGDENYYISTKVNKAEVEKVVIAVKRDDTFEGSIVNIRDLFFNDNLLNREVILSEINSIKKKFPSKEGSTIKIKAILFESERRLLEIFTSLGFKYYSEIFVGNVSNGLDYLSSFVYENKEAYSKFQISKMDFKSDIDEVIKVDAEASNSTKSCLMKLESKAQIDVMTDYYKTMCNEGTCWKLTVQGNIIGVIGFLKHQYCPDGYVIGAFAISSKYQGLGLSKLLLKKALSTMQKKNIDIYTFNTSTDQLLSLCKGLKCEVKKKFLYQGY